MHMKKKSLRIILPFALCVMVMTMFSVTAFAAGDVSGAIESTWNAAKSQVQTVVNNVVFPVIDMIPCHPVPFRQGRHLSIFEYRKHGQFEFVAPLHSVRLPHLHSDRASVYLVDPCKSEQ